MSEEGALPAVTTLRDHLAQHATDDRVPEAADDVRLACWMLLATQPWPAAAAETMQALFEAHRDGEATPSVWRMLRKAAVALGDSGDPDLSLFGAVAEAAAWPVQASKAGLVELTRAISLLRATQAARATGWTSDDEAEAIAILTKIAQGDGSHAPAREEIPDLFTTAHPTLGRRFAMQLGASNASFASFRREVAAWLAGAKR